MSIDQNTSTVTVDIQPFLSAQPDVLALIQAVFRGRSDIVAKAWSYTDKTGETRKGYAPVCLNRGVQGICPRTTSPKTPCRTCPTQAYTGINNQLLADHLEGKLVLGFYPLLPDGATHCIAADLDNHSGGANPHTALLKIATVLRSLKIPHYALRSRSGSGHHLYLFFSTPVQAWKARAVFTAIVKQAGILDDATSGFDRFFPSQDRLPDAKSPGNLISLPLQGQAMAHGHTLLLDPDSQFTVPYADQVAVLKTIQRIDESTLDALITSMGLTPLPPAAKVVNPPAAPTVPARIPQGQRNSMLVSIAGTLQKRGLDDEAILAALHVQNQRACDPPLPDSEVDAIARSISRYQKGALSPTDQAGNLQKLAPAFNSSTVHPQMVLPAGYSITAQGHVVKTEIDKYKNIINRTICYSPVAIIRRFEDVNLGTVFVELAWLNNGAVKRHIAELFDISENKNLVGLSRYSFPANSNNAKDMNTLLAQLAEVNKHLITTRMITSKLGWVLELPVFMWGKTPIGPSNQPTPEVSFKGRDDGDDLVASGFYAEGTLEGWAAAVNLTYEYPFVFIQVLASLAVPLMKFVRVQNKVIDLAKETTFGKTTSAMLAAASWGNPDKNARKRVLFSWKNTLNWFEQVAALLNYLPFIVDDTKDAINKEIVSEVIYLHASGSGKGRATLTGTRCSGHWTSFFITNGEQPAVDNSSKHGGTRARTLSMWGAPFKDDKQGALVKAIAEAALENFGHAGPRVVQYVLDHPEVIALFPEAYKEAKRHYSAKAAGNAVADRLGELFAFLAASAPIIHAAIPVLKPRRTISEILGAVWDSVVHGAKEADRALAALAVVWDWAVRNQSKFYAHKLDQDGQEVSSYGPQNVWAGRWDHHKGNWAFVGITASALKEVLEAADFDFTATVNTWADRGWLDVRGKGKNQRNIKVGTAKNAKLDCYCIPRTVIEKVLGINI